MHYRKMFVLVLESFPRWIRITELKKPKLSMEIEFRSFIFSFTNILQCSEQPMLSQLKPH